MTDVIYNPQQKIYKHTFLEYWLIKPNVTTMFVLFALLYLIKGPVGDLQVGKSLNS